MAKVTLENIRKFFGNVKAVGFLMECYEKGLINSEDTKAVDLRFGNADAMVAAVDLAGQGLGRLGEFVANGVKKAAESIGRESEKFAIHSKGLGPPTAQEAAKEWG